MAIGFQRQRPQPVAHAFQPRNAPRAVRQAPGPQQINRNQAAQRQGQQERPIRHQRRRRGIAPGEDGVMQHEPRQQRRAKPMAYPPDLLPIGQVIAPDGGECQHAKQQPGQSSGNERGCIQAQHQRAGRVIRAIKSCAAWTQIKQRVQQRSGGEDLRENLMPAQAAIHPDAGADHAKPAREQKFQQQRCGRHHGDGAGCLIQPGPRGTDQPPAKGDR